MGHFFLLSQSRATAHEMAKSAWTFNKKWAFALRVARV
jgi:hypothetical protein